LFASELKKNKIPVVGIDRGPREAFEEWCEENSVMIVYGDFHSHSLLKKAGAAKARCLIFASGDDLTNLEGAMSAYELIRTEKGPVRLIWVQIANEQLAETARFFVRTRGRVGIRFFDTYRIASARMVAKHFNQERRKGVREINILGFGKFGRDLFEVMVRDLFDGEKYSFRIVDIDDRGEEVYALARELNVDNWVTFRQTAIQEMKLVDNVDKAFFVCTDDDLGNLTAAMLLARKKNANNIYVRMAYWPMSAVASRLCENRDMYFVNINSLLLEEIRELPGIFEPAKEEDLKRINGGPGRIHTPH
jgi:Trk K+ transport system NAD-binding subunit